MELTLGNEFLYNTPQGARFLFFWGFVIVFCGIPALTILIGWLVFPAANKSNDRRWKSFLEAREPDKVEILSATTKGTLGRMVRRQGAGMTMLMGILGAGVTGILLGFLLILHRNKLPLTYHCIIRFRGQKYVSEIGFPFSQKYKFVALESSKHKKYAVFVSRDPVAGDPVLWVPDLQQVIFLRKQSATPPGLSLKEQLAEPFFAASSHFFSRRQIDRFLKS